MDNRPEFAPADAREAAALIAENPFAVLVTAGPDGIVATHLPLLYDETNGAFGTLTGHLAADNSHAALVTAGLESLAIFTGPHGYISSSWYPRRPDGLRSSAPTWNYSTVHCHGRPEILPETATRRHLAALVEAMERGRADRWRMGELGTGGLERRMPRIIGFSLPVSRLQARFKMSQTEEQPDTAAAIAALRGEDPALAALMARHNPSAGDQD